MNAEILPKRPDKTNERFLRTYTPIIPTNPLIIDKKWFEQQSDDFQKTIIKQFQNIELEEEFTYPNHFHENNDIYIKFLMLYKEQYTFDKYYELIHNCVLLPMSDEEREILARNIKFGIDISTELKEKIEMQLEKVNGLGNNCGVFVKTYGKSSKYDLKMFPSFNIDDVLANLKSDSIIKTFLLPDRGLVFRPWLNDINHNREFRFFVLNKKVKCISQQFFEHISYINPEFVIYECIKLWNSILGKVDYSDCTIDCYINNKNEAILIEINSGGPWGGAGSGLFSWSEIMNFNNENKIYFRAIVEKC